MGFKKTLVVFALGAAVGVGAGNDDLRNQGLSYVESVFTQVQTTAAEKRLADDKVVLVQGEITGFTSVDAVDALVTKWTAYGELPISDAARTNLTKVLDAASAKRAELAAKTVEAQPKVDTPPVENADVKTEVQSDVKVQSETPQVDNAEAPPQTEKKWN